MRLHRFLINDKLELKHSFWIHDKSIVNQWSRVLRFQVGQEVILFDGKTHDRLYRITVIDDREVHVEHVTDLKRQTPTIELYLFWSLLKKDKNDWVLQKATEVGVSHFIPLLADRSEKTGFNEERAHKIIVEAAEQCGRSDIPSLREPMKTSTALKDYSDKITLYIAEQGSGSVAEPKGEMGILVGPEGGWSETEKSQFIEHNVMHVSLGQFTLRAETAAVVASHKLLQ